MAQDESNVQEAGLKKDDKKDNKGNVVDYLQAPRRKRKSYVIMALGRSTQELSSGIEGFVRANYKAVAMAQPESASDLQKMFSRQIVLVVIDDEFVELDQVLELISDLKRRKNNSAVPVLFLTRHPERLVESYNKKLGVYQEADDYIHYPKSEVGHILSKIKTGLTSTYRRRSRRYKVDIPLKYYLLADDKLHDGHLIDLSIHGGMLKADDGRIYRPGEQLKLSIPVSEFLSSNDGDYLKLSARVRRVFIGGDQAGISFEHVSDQQMFKLTKFLTDLVNDQASRRSGRSRASR